MLDGYSAPRRGHPPSIIMANVWFLASRLLDILMEINNSPQIPPEKRVDVALPPSSNPNDPVLPIDREYSTKAGDEAAGLKRLEALLKEVPHLNYGASKECHPASVTDLATSEDNARPANFLSADDIDDYLHLVDSRLEPDRHVPTLAPLAHPNVHPPTHPLLKNPNSATSWLRRHAPHIFLQGHEPGEGAHPDGEEGDRGGASGGSGAAAAGAGGEGHGHGTGRKTRGGKGERGGRASTRGKRASGAGSLSRVSATADRGADVDASMDDDPDFSSTPVPKGKRKRDDDGGYRPKGSGSRPTKKKRRSEGGEGTPTVRKSKKDMAAAEAS
jgi:hypothetical protein